MWDCSSSSAVATNIGDAERNRPKELRNEDAEKETLGDLSEFAETFAGFAKAPPEVAEPDAVRLELLAVLGRVAVAVERVDTHRCAIQFFAGETSFDHTGTVIAHERGNFSIFSHVYNTFLFIILFLLQCQTCVPSRKGSNPEQWYQFIKQEWNSNLANYPA